MKSVNLIFPAIIMIIAVLSFATAVFNLVEWIKLIRKPKAVWHLICAIIALYVAVVLFIWIKRVYLLGFWYY